VVRVLAMPRGPCYVKLAYKFCENASGMDDTT